MKRILQTEYTFTPGAGGVGTIVFKDLTAIDLKKLFMITNATKGVILYNASDPALIGTVLGNTLTLATTTTGQDSTDNLQIFYENGDTSSLSLNSAISQVSYCTITNGGTTAYATGATVVFSGGTGAQATGQVILDAKKFVIGIKILTFGAYTVIPTTVTISPVSTGAGATATVVCGQFNRVMVDGEATATVQTYGTSTATTTYEGSIDGLGFFPIVAVNITNGSQVTSTSSNTISQIEIAGLKYIQARCSSWTSGALLTNIRLSNGIGLVGLDMSLPTGPNTIGNVNAIQSGAWKLTASTATGYTPGKLVSAASTNATVVKASAGTLGSIHASNINTAPRYLKLYNKATAPTVGTDIPVATYLIPGATTGGQSTINIPTQGLNFPSGISFALTANAIDTDNTAVAGSECVVNYSFI
jgi:hypothetical protein